MNAARARETAAKVVNNLTGEPIPDYAEQVLLDDDAVVHLANAYQQIEHADASGIPLSALYDVYDDVETVLRFRVHDVLVDTADGAPDRRRHEDIAAIIEPEGEEMVSA